MLPLRMQIMHNLKRSRRRAILLGHTAWSIPLSRGLRAHCSLEEVFHNVRLLDLIWVSVRYMWFGRVWFSVRRASTYSLCEHEIDSNMLESWPACMQHASWDKHDCQGRDSLLGLGMRT